jgi:hypothetical protein
VYRSKKLKKRPRPNKELQSNFMVSGQSMEELRKNSAFPLIFEMGTYRTRANVLDFMSSQGYSGI